MRTTLWVLALAVVIGCGNDTESMTQILPDAALPDGGSDADGLGRDGGSASWSERFMMLETNATVQLPDLSGDVYVLRTEGNIPHIYASNRQDLMRVYGYIVASDRFWMMDLARRLGTGRLSSLFGPTVLSTDITTRSKGLHLVADRIWNALPDSRKAEVSAFADGVNAYIESVKAGESPPPSEFVTAFPLLGAMSPAELMTPFTGHDIAAYAAVIAEESACSRDEIGRTRAIDELLSRVDAPSNAIDWSDILEDLFYRIDPLIFVQTGQPGVRQAAYRQQDVQVPNIQRVSGISARMLDSLSKRVKGARRFRGHIVGSNAWAASGTHTDTGGPMVAGDGHLELTAPAYFHQAGLDLSIFGNENWHVRGNFMAGIPALGVGTNGHVAWSFTCFYSDTIDYFSEALIIDDEGKPVATLFQGQEQPLKQTMETYTVRSAPALGGEGGEVSSPTFELFDGRRLLSAEGRLPLEGEQGIDFGDGPVVLEDMNGDGIISGISYDATFLDAGDLLGGYFDLSESLDLQNFKNIQRKLMVTGSHFVAIERSGNIMSTGYHASPCRDGLERTADGKRFASGADPQLLLDGTRYGGFEVELDEVGHPQAGVPETPNCTVPYASFPITENPDRGFIVSANNDPSGLSFDGSIADDIYIGGPWDIGFRAHRIDERLGQLVDENSVSIESMASIQGDVYSSGGARWTPHILEAVAYAREGINALPELSDSDARLFELYQQYHQVIDEAVVRLEQWSENGFLALSGVETVYHTPSDQELRDAVSTTIFNFWLSAFQKRVLAGLSIREAHRLTDDNTLGRFFDRILDGRGPNNPRDLKTYDATIEESSLFDDVNTPEVERSRELILLALIDGLEAAAQAPIQRGLGGFGTTDMDQWLWGLRHMLRIDSIIAPFLTDSPSLLAFANLFAITPRNLPLVDGPVPGDDPRSGLPGFPRPGDNYSVDASEHGFSLTDFAYRAGPVMRMVIGLSADGQVVGQNIMPGGQSGRKESPHFADQLKYWLGNRALPLHFHIEEVLANSSGKELFTSPSSP